ncbi:MAG: molybdenum cofactor biosynthesis protein MoaD [Saprospiraceae bacterium]|nr:molybdenum cofactor biosynthesis protein MoaD [Saprospiraceae bacterium]
MAKINFTRALKRFYPDLGPMDIQCDRVSDLIEILEEKYPGLKNYLVDDHGHLRKHVNIFVQERLIKDRATLLDPIDVDDEVYIMQALSGG